MKAQKIMLAGAMVAALSLSATAFAPKADIVDTAVSAGNFKTLVKLVQQAGLVNTLKSDGPFTVFAPTDEAFGKVPKATLNAVASDDNKLRGVLTYHVVSGKVLAADVVKMNGKSVKTVNGAELKIKVKDGKVFLNDVQVVKTDIMTKNGVIHVLGGVLIPPKAKASTEVTSEKSCGSCSGK